MPSIPVGPVAHRGHRLDGTSPYSIWGPGTFFHPSTTPRLGFFRGRRGGRKRRRTRAGLCSRPAAPGRGHPGEGTSPLSKSTGDAGLRRVMAQSGRNIAPFNSRELELRFPPLDHRASVFLGDRRRGRSVENARPPVPLSEAGGVRIAARSFGRNIALFNWPRGVAERQEYC